MNKKKSPTAQRKEPNPGAQRPADKGSTRRPDFDTQTVGHRPSDTSPPRKNEENRRADNTDEDDLDE